MVYERDTGSPGPGVSCVRRVSTEDPKKLLAAHNLKLAQGMNRTMRTTTIGFYDFAPPVTKFENGCLYLVRNQRVLALVVYFDNTFPAGSMVITLPNLESTINKIQAGLG